MIKTPGVLFTSSTKTPSCLLPTNYVTSIMLVWARYNGREGRHRPSSKGRTEKLITIKYDQHHSGGFSVGVRAELRPKESLMAKECIENPRQREQPR